jgi:hypothetical protein
MSEKKGYGLLLAMLEPPESMEEEFNAWYDTEHIPERRAIPGFLTAQRFVAPEGSPKYLALYDLGNREVLQSEAYRRVGPENYSPWTRRINQHIPIFIREEWGQVVPGDGLLSDEAGAVLLWAKDVSVGREAEYGLWYSEEWIPKLSRIDGFLQVRRFERINADAQDLDIVEFRDMSFLKKYTGDLPPAAGSESLFRDVRRKAYLRYHPV